MHLNVNAFFPNLKNLLVEFCPVLFFYNLPYGLNCILPA